MRNTNRLIRRVAVTSLNVGLGLMLSGCGSSSPTAATPEPSPSAPAPVPTPTPTASSPYAGNWAFTIWLTGPGSLCGRSAADVDKRVGPVPVTVKTDGTFTVPSPGNASGTIDAAGNIRLSLAARSDSCPAGEGAGGCATLGHCDGTSVQADDVSKWILVR